MRVGSRLSPAHVRLRVPRSEEQWVRAKVEVEVEDGRINGGAAQGRVGA